ncbi:MAG: sulfotransferase [Chitinivibrionales bacterium]|nr:sulfotransferase [Chitinivibrionales bacterium]
MRKAIVKPVIILGVGRSGTTLLHRLLAGHPQVSWLGRITDFFPALPRINSMVMRIIDMPVAGRLIAKKVKPGEAYTFWDYYCKNFSTTKRDLHADDLDRATKEKLYSAFSSCTTPARHRLLIKITGWPRLGFMHSLFPDALFIHMVRDGRAVANSRIKEKWWTGRQGPENWIHGTLPAKGMQRWEESGKEPVVLAALEWKNLVRAFEDSKERIAAPSLMHLRYEDLCENPGEMLSTILKHCELSEIDSYMREVSAGKIKNTNYKWQQEQHADLQEKLNAAIKDELIMYGYS